MLNLVEKFTPAAVEATNEDGVVAIEYVIVAGALVVALVGLWTLFGDQLADKLEDIIGNVPDGSTPAP
jgi:Flp pilus assembly pilin Flp